MSEMNDEVRDLIEKTARIRYEFLQVELKTCATALDLAKFELSVGNLEVTGSEVATIEKGIATIHRFLPEMPEGDARREIEARVGLLARGLEPVRLERQVRRGGEAAG